MKVLVFTTQFHKLNGAERLAVELAQGLNERGVHADVLGMYGEDMPGAAEAKRGLLQRGIPNVHLLGMRPHPPLASMVPAILKLRRLLRKEKYDMVETSMMSPTVLASWASLGLRTRHVAGLHDVFRKDRQNGARHKIWRFSVRRNRKIRFYAISDYVARHWISYSKTPASRTRTVYNAIPDDCFEAAPERDSVRRELGMPPEGRIALFVGRLLKRKGIDTILEALEPILETENLYLLYVGDRDAPENFFPDDKGLLDRLTERVEKQDLSERVRFLGRRSDVPRLMASSDLLVHPARIEGFGLVLAEALAAGLPVAASDVEGIPEVLKGTRSLMTPPDDPEAFRAAVLEALRRPDEEVERCVARGRARAEDFRIQKRVRNMIELFENVLSGSL